VRLPLVSRRNRWRVGRQALAPQLVDQEAGRDNLPGPQRQQHEQGAQPRPADLTQRAGAVMDLQRPKHRDLHPFIVVHSAAAW
jgi:hypothetical protein